jgi:hypothetical protein
MQNILNYFYLIKMICQNCSLGEGIRVKLRVNGI